MKNIKFLAVVTIVISALSLSACTKQNNKPVSSSTPNVSNSAATSTSYTLEDVKMHASRSDCWTAIGGKVYNLTSYIASGQHKPIIVDGCGIDSTDMFNNIDKHSGSKVKNMLPGMIIGTLNK